MHSGEIVAEHRRWLSTRLSELCQKIQEPLNLSKSRGQSSVFCFGRTAADGGLLRALPGDQIGAKEDAISRRGSSIIRVVSPVRICKDGWIALECSDETLQNRHTRKNLPEWMGWQSWPLDCENCWDEIERY